MAKLSEEKILNEVHLSALAEFDSIQNSVRDEREQCLEDRRFYSISGAQWEGNLGEQFENKPKFEVNKVHLSVIRIINEYRNNRITVNFSSKDGVENDQLADTCNSLYRSSEKDSTAEEAYDNAFEEAVSGGFGAWRLRAEYEDEEDYENDYQKIIFEPIFDADTSVFFDLQAKRQDKKDATSCFVITSMDKKAYEETYEDSPSSWDKNISSGRVFDWCTPDVVYVAEYYKVESENIKVSTWTHIDGEVERIIQIDAEQEAKLLAVGAQQTGYKKAKRKRVRKYILSGGGVLEDCGYIAGNCIPVIPVYGKRWYVDNIERCMGQVRLPKDSQRLKNIQLSKLAEVSSLSPIEKPIFTPEQVAGHATMWSEDNVKNWPYLLINPTTDANGNEVGQPPVGYTRPPQIPPAAMAALLQITEEDMSDLLGNQQGGDEIASNVAQGTVELIQNRLDMQTYIYMSNMAKAMRRCGEVWLSMAKDIFVEEGRVMKGIGDQGELSRIQLLKPVIDDELGQIYENDLSKAKFDVDVGPSSSTRRASTVRSLINMASITDDPETKQVLGAMAMMNMEGEGIGDTRAFFRKKLLRMGVLEPTEQEAKDLEEEMKNAEPSANDKYLDAAAQKELSEASERQSNTILKQAQADKARVETLETLTDIDLKEQKQALEVIDSLGARVIPPDVSGSEVRGI